MYSVVTYSTLLNSEQSWSLLKINGADSGRTQQRALNLGLNLSQVCHSGPTTAQLLWMIGYSPTVAIQMYGGRILVNNNEYDLKSILHSYIPFTEKNSFLGVRSRKKILSQRELNNFRRGRNHLIAVIRKDSCESTSTFYSSGDVQFCRNSNQFHSRRHYIRLSVK